MSWRFHMCSDNFQQRSFCRDLEWQGAEMQDVFKKPRKDPQCCSGWWWQGFKQLAKADFGPVSALCARLR
eukprot:163341-Amphidinium_carterae.1